MKNEHNNTEHDNLVNQVVKKLGINILLFQQIERGLKLLLPFISVSDSSKTILDDIRKQTEKVKLQTLGALVNKFIESAEYHPDYFPNSLKKIVNERNKLVHHFRLNILNTEEGCRKCLIELEEQRKEAFSFYRNIQLFVLGLTYSLQDIYGESHPNIKLLYQELKKNIIEDVEYINELNPSDTAWQNTKIVKWLYLAEDYTEKKKDMTLLSEAEKFIKNHAPECTPQKYGIKTLKGILKVSGLFKIIESEDGSILYKSYITRCATYNDRIRVSDYSPIFLIFETFINQGLKISCTLRYIQKYI